MVRILLVLPVWIIPGGSASQTFTIDTIDDVFAEGAENFTVSIGTIVDSGNAFEAVAADWRKR